MFGFHDFIAASISDTCKLEKLGIIVIKKNLFKQGIVLSETELSEITEKLADLKETKSFSVHIDDERISSETGLSKDEIGNALSSCMKEFAENCGKFMESYVKNIPEMLNSVVDTVSGNMSSRLMQQYDEIYVEHSNMYGALRDEIKEYWDRPLKMFQCFIALAEESSKCYMDSFSEEPEKFAALAILLPNLHAKLIQIAKEILCLLSNGFPEGAFARWRSLHELSVICHFISETGNETAVRFIDHETIEMFTQLSSANEYKRYSGVLRNAAVDATSLKSEYDRCISEYGNGFLNDYGWASNVIKKKRPTFADIEEYTQNKHQRPFCVTANSKIHLNAIGILYNLGSPPSTDEILSGPSSLGLGEPAILTVQSLAYGLTQLLTSDPKIDNLIASKILILHMNELIDSFDESEKILERDICQYDTDDIGIRAENNGSE
jgi:hypothetical protein